MSEPYVTGTGQVITVHSARDCAGRRCCIHNPSNHHMKDWPTNWRHDRKMMERICEHGIGHPDPDDLAFKKAVSLAAGHTDYDTGIHGCDGCCVPPK